MCGLKQIRSTLRRLRCLFCGYLPTPAPAVWAIWGFATSPDAASSFYNLAKTPFNKKDIGIGLTYTPWLKDLGLNDVYLLAASGFKKLDETSAVSASLRYFSLGNIQFTDNNGTELGTGHPREFAFDLGYSRKLSDKLSIALAGRYIYSNLASGYAGAGTHLSAR